MISSVITSILAFISTDIDDIFVLMLLFAQAHTKRERYRIIAGHTLGIGLLVLLSLLGTFGISRIPSSYTGLLGLIPIALGIRAFAEYRKSTGSESETAQAASDSDGIREHTGGIFGTAAITAANGADNVGVYIPLFSGFSPVQLSAAMAVFFLTNLLWCALAIRLSELPVIQRIIARYKELAVGLVFLLIGIYVLIKSGVPGILLG